MKDSSEERYLQRKEEVNKIIEEVIKNNDQLILERKEGQKEKILFSSKEIVNIDVLNIAKEKIKTISNCLLSFEFRNSTNSYSKIDLALYIRPVDESNNKIREKLIELLVNYPKLFQRYTTKGEKYLPIFKINNFLDWSRKDINQIKNEFIGKFDNFLSSEFINIVDYVEKIAPNLN